MCATLAERIEAVREPFNLRADDELLRKEKLKGIVDDSPKEYLDSSEKRTSIVRRVADASAESVLISHAVREIEHRSDEAVHKFIEAELARLESSIVTLEAQTHAIFDPLHPELESALTEAEAGHSSTRESANNRVYETHSVKLSAKGYFALQRQLDEAKSERAQVLNALERYEDEPDLGRNNGR